MARARDMHAEGEGRLLVNVASLWPVVDASGAQMDQTAMMRYLNEMIWFPAAFLAGNISFEAVDDSSARATLTDFVAQRYRTADARSPETWSTPVTGYSEFEGLRLPVCGTAIYKLSGGDIEYIEVTITELPYDTGAAPPEGRV